MQKIFASIALHSSLVFIDFFSSFLCVQFLINFIEHVDKAFYMYFIFLSLI